jgi:formate hydrogenlyase subunit 3/multisubunit Na+/H+ antiporter MnhD subunit
MEVLLTILFFSVPILAILPLFMPWWRWFIGSILVFLAAAGLIFLLAVKELSTQTHGEGPAFFGLTMYYGGVGILFVTALVLKLLIFVIRRSVRIYRHRAQQKRFRDSDDN